MQSQYSSRASKGGAMNKRDCMKQRPLTKSEQLRWKIFRRKGFHIGRMDDEPNGIYCWRFPNGIAGNSSVDWNRQAAIRDCLMRNDVLFVRAKVE